MVEVPDLGGAAEAGDAAREAHHGQDLAARAHAGVARRPRRVGDHLELEAEARVPVEHPEDDGDEHGDPDAERDRDTARTPPIVANGQVAASGIAWPWGKTAALGDVVSRQ